MARTRILKKDGSPTPFFWSDKDGNTATHRTVYKQTDSGIKRMRGVHFNVTTKKIVKEAN
jgi:hypothetical protein